jgi:SAM-dependent methyltransferase
MSHAWLAALTLLALSSLVSCTDSNRTGVGLNSEKTKGPNAFQAITGDDTDEERERWNTVFKTHQYVFGKEPIEFLKDHLQMLPIGRSLVIPLEEGRNAVFLARNGFSVAGVDFSEIAIQKANRLARENKVKITSINADLNHYVIDKEAYDVIVDIDFHRPRLVQQIKQGLKKGGFVVYQASIVSPGKAPSGSHQDQLLPGQLKEAFRDFQILIYQETSEGDSRLASMIAKKP